MNTDPRQGISIRLVPMSEGDYARFLEWAVLDYAQAKTQSGRWKPEDAQRLAAETFQNLLPDGLSTPNQYLLTIRDDNRLEDSQREIDEPVGFLWFGLQEQDGMTSAYLYEFTILKEYRRRGYGTAALRALEEAVRELGLDRIALHVFGHNEAARALYAKSGYVERNITMVKQIDDTGIP